MNFNQNKFASKIILKFHLFSIVGFLLGVKLCDLIFYDANKYLLIAELEEEKFWNTFGEPKYLKPEYVESLKPEANGEMRKTYIKINLEKDSYMPKIE